MYSRDLQRPLKGTSCSSTQMSTSRLNRSGRCCVHLSHIFRKQKACPLCREESVIKSEAGAYHLESFEEHSGSEDQSPTLEIYPQAVGRFPFGLVYTCQDEKAHVCTNLSTSLNPDTECLPCRFVICNISWIMSGVKKRSKS